ncbi:DUF2189 domain-containing protein [Phaeobacter sp. CNT1-3]|nr:DUF2189 domain-containing protein [Phaeobacter sp. CNT1-3]
MTEAAEQHATAHQAHNTHENGTIGGLQHGVPEFGAVTLGVLAEALRRGWHDFMRAPVFGVIFASVYVLLGIFMVWLTRWSGHSYWLVFAAAGFPLIGPFTAVGLYEVSRRLERQETLSMKGIFGVILLQSQRQLPSISAIIIFMFLFWFFLAHMIFAVFMGTVTMTNVSTSFEVYLTSNGLSMLAVGSVVGAGFALLLFMITVVSLPMLLDREVDYVSAMIASFQLVQENFVPMILWAGFVAALTFVAMLPAFMGLFIVLPLLGHATWHLYDLLLQSAEVSDE